MIFDMNFKFIADNNIHDLDVFLKMHNIPIEFASQCEDTLDDENVDTIGFYGFKQFVVRKWRSSKETNNLDRQPPMSLDDTWQPEDEAINQLESDGYALKFICQQVQSFIFFYNDRVDKPNSYSLSMQFIYHVKRAASLWKDEQSRLVDETTAPKMIEQWWPSDDAFTVLLETYSIPKLLAEGYVGEFVVYWMDRQRTPVGGSWNNAFIQHAQYKYSKERRA